MKWVDIPDSAVVGAREAIDDCNRSMGILYYNERRNMWRWIASGSYGVDSADGSLSLQEAQDAVVADLVIARMGG
jgi:hypothetical protein